MMNWKQGSCCVFSCLAVIVTLGCSASFQKDRAYISNSIEEKTGGGLRPEVQADMQEIPDTVTLTDGLTVDEAIAVALWNNPVFQSELLSLGYARADIQEARSLRNPIFSMLFPLGPKQLEFSVNAPVDFLWQRPKRVSSANLDAEKTAENLIQSGLAVVRDVKTSWADLELALSWEKIGIELTAIENEIASISDARLRAGDISELETASYHISAGRSKETAIQYAHNADQESIRLRALLGNAVSLSDIRYVFSEPSLPTVNSSDTLLKNALAARPDLRAAEIALESAGEKVGWEKSKIFALTAVLDANGEGKEGFEMGPGLQTELPLFNWNGAGRTRAQTAFELAVQNYAMLQQHIETEVMSALNDYESYKSTYELYLSDILPSVEDALNYAEASYATGETSYLSLLIHKQEVIRTRMNAAEALSAVKRSMADLEYAVGYSL